MSNYTKSTNFTAKDSEPTGDTNKVVRGSEFDTEFNAISTAISTKSDLAGPTFTGTATFDGITATGTVNFTGGSVTTNIDGGTIDGVTIGGSTPGAGTFSSLTATTANIDGGNIDGTVIGASSTAAISGTTGTFSGAVTGYNLNVSNWDTAYSWGDHGVEGYLTSVTFSDIDAGAVTLSTETFVDSDTQIPTNAAVIDYVAATIPLITEVNDLSVSVTWANVPDANITESSVTQHEAALSIAATQLTGNITVPGNVYLAPSGTGFTELRGNTNAGAIRFNCEVNTHGVTLKGPPHSASATYELELPDADGSAGQFLKTDGSGKLSFDTVSVNNISGDVTITGELLADSYNEKFKRVSSVVTTTASSTMTDWSYESKSLSVASQDGIPNGMAFNNDGTKLYISGNSNDTIYQYALTTAYDVSTGSYESKSFSVATQLTGPCGLAFNTSGTKMYVQDFNADTVFQYSLSTAFDVSTASYDSVSLDASGQDTSTQAMVFKPDGTSLFIAGNTNDTVYQYDLTTAFDLSTASYASKSFNASTQVTTAAGIGFTDSGTKMYILDNSDQDIHQYTLTTAYDVSTASYASASFDTTSQDSSPFGMVFTPDGTKLYVVGRTNDAVFQYETTSLAVSTTFDCEDANVFETELDANTTVVFSNPPASGATVVAGYNLSIASYDSKSFSVASQDTTPRTIRFNSTGTKMFLLGSANDSLYQYSLSTAYDVSTASYDSVSFSVATQDAGPVDFSFNSDGTKLFMVGLSTDTIYQYSLSTAFDLSTISYDSVSFDVSSQDTLPLGITFNTDGTKLFVAGNTNDSVFQYSLSTGFDLSTTSYDSVSFSVTSQDTSPGTIAFNSDGTKMFVAGYVTETIYQYNLTTGFDISTASYASVSFSVASQDATLLGFSFNSDGTKMYVSGSANDSVYQYTTGTSVINDSTAYGMSLKVVQDSGASGYTVTWPTSVKWPAATAPTLTATASAEDQFVFYTKDGGTNWYGFTAGQALA